ncbi:hypothetical protein [Helicobacter sp.]|uniref:hypothetical protein n=1 Tax=Helicobacter sp. TaxID=218 RepID=UPI002A90FBE6|nr:hypothetical protein [Helicobacter sp.]MDY5556158.1 hypothetical protein [Helicobacter sp.]
MNLKAIAHKKARECGYLKELLMLEKIYKNVEYVEYADFLGLIRINNIFCLEDIEILESFAGLFDKNLPFFREWLENETEATGRESILTFLALDLKLDFEDFLEGGKEVKERIVQAFVYSCSVTLYDYFCECEALAQILRFNCFE